MNAIVTLALEAVIKVTDAAIIAPVAKLGIDNVLLHTKSVNCIQIGGISSSFFTPFKGFNTIGGGFSLRTRRHDVCLFLDRSYTEAKATAYRINPLSGKVLCSIDYTRCHY